MQRTFFTIALVAIAIHTHAAELLKQNNAVDIAVGPFLDDVDAKTPETALTIAQADVRLKKNENNWGQKNESTSATHEENGWYEVKLNATDTNTLGLLQINVSKSGALPVWKSYMVVPANVHDSLVGRHGADTLQADVTQFGGSNGAFGSGRPEVNVSHISGDTAAADNLEDTFDEESGSGVGMALESLTVSNASGTAVTFSSTGGNGHGMLVTGNGTGDGMQINSGASGGGMAVSGIDFGIAATGYGTGNSHGFWAASSTGSGSGIFCHAGGTGDDFDLANNKAPSFVSVLTNQLAPADGSISSAKFAAGAIDANAIANNAIDRAALAADTGLQSIRSGTAQAGAASSITLDASASSTTDLYKYSYVYVSGGTGAGQYRIITGYNGTSKVATVTPAWVTNPDNTSTFALLPAGIASVEAWLGAAAAATTVPGVPEVDITHVLGDPVCD